MQNKYRNELNNERLYTSVFEYADQLKSKSPVVSNSTYGTTLVMNFRKIRSAK